jgi:hypothetical protein
VADGGLAVCLAECALPIGRVAGDRLRIRVAGDLVVDEAVADLEAPHRDAIPTAMAQR